MELRYTPEEAEFADSSNGASAEDILEADIAITSGLIETFLAQMPSWEALEVGSQTGHEAQNLLCMLQAFGYEQFRVADFD